MVGGVNSKEFVEVHRDAVEHLGGAAAANRTDLEYIDYQNKYIRDNFHNAVIIGVTSHFDERNNYLAQFFTLGVGQ